MSSTPEATAVSYRWCPSAISSCLSANALAMPSGGSATGGCPRPPRRARRPDARTEARRRREEDRLGVRPEGLQQPLSSLLRARVGPLVRQDDSVLVRLDLPGPRQGRAGCARPVRPDVPLLERPEGRPLVPHEDAVGQPLAPQPRGVRLVVGQRQVDDVERASSTELLALRLVDHVVGRCHEPLGPATDSS